MVCEGKLFHLHGANEKDTNSYKVPELVSSQEETDTRVILSECMQNKKVLIRTTDSEMFFIYLYYSKTELEG